VDSARLSVDNAALARPVLAALQGCATNKPPPPSARGAPDSHRTGIADPPEDWPVASPRDDAAVTPREPSAILDRVC